MNRRERRYGRMYSLPLLLALTGLALLPLEWVLRLSGFDAFGDLGQTIIHNCLCVAYPLVLLFLYLFRVSPKTAHTFAMVSLGLSLVQLLIVLFCDKTASQGLSLWIPGHMLLPHIGALKEGKNAQNVILIISDICFLLSSLSAVFTCLVYAKVKASSDKRNAEFDRRHGYLKKDSTPPPPKEEPTPEPTEPVPVDPSWKYSPKRGKAKSSISATRVMTVPDSDKQ